MPRNHASEPKAILRSWRALICSRIELLIDLLGDVDLSPGQIGQVDDHEGILQGVGAQLFHCLHVDDGLRQEGLREPAADLHVPLDHLAGLDGFDVLLDAAEEAEELLQTAFKAIQRGDVLGTLSARDSIPVRTSGLHELGDAALLGRARLYPERHLVKLEQVLGRRGADVDIGLHAEGLARQIGVHEQVHRARQHRRGGELRLLRAVELVDVSGQRIDLRASCEPTHNDLAGRDLLSQGQHLLVVVLVHVGLLVGVPVHDREAIGDVDDATLADPAKQGADDTLGTLWSAHKGIQDLQHRDGVHAAAEGLLDAALLDLRRDVEVPGRHDFAVLGGKPPHGCGSRHDR
mmetsp:Transcript_74993/g.202594  ORF Transcript_74993/g.202594 Transcript_74993/m.202594 type:complete len:348 (+) Transcript_74993:150-1193(+)